MNLRLIWSTLLAINLHLLIGYFLPYPGGQDRSRCCSLQTQIKLINAPALIAAPMIATPIPEHSTNLHQGDISAASRANPRTRTDFPQENIFPPKKIIRPVLPPHPEDIIRRNFSRKKNIMRLGQKKLTIQPTTESHSLINSESKFTRTEIIPPQGREFSASNLAPSEATSNTPNQELEIIPARFNAAYLHNPAPEYPRLAQQNGWEGTVKLKIWVSEQGRAERVDIHHSSGYDVLDSAARTAVQNWRFIPARRGNTLIASVIIAPLVFRLP